MSPAKVREQREKPSPSMRREWIEILENQLEQLEKLPVSLHAEGVD